MVRTNRLREVAVNPTGASPKVYMTNQKSNNVSVIDTATNSIAASVSVGEYPYGVALSPDGTKVYVTNSWYNTVSVIDTATNTVTATMPVGNYPIGIAITPDGKKVYVANYNDNITSVIDASTNTVTNIESVRYYSTGIAITPDGTKVYVTNGHSSTVTVIDIATNKVAATLYVGKDPEGVVINPQGTKVYVTSCEGDNTGLSSVYIIDTATYNSTLMVSFHGSVLRPGIAVSPDGKKVYVATNDGTLHMIDTATNNFIATVKVDYPYGVAVTPDGSKVYLTNPYSNNISVIDAATNKVIDTVDVRYHPEAFGQFIGSLPVKRALPTANFSSNVTSGYAPLDVQFTDLSRNATDLQWNFGDNTSNISVTNPEHLFTSTGLFNVVLTASNGNGSDSKSMTINVTSKPALPVLPGCANPPADLNNDGLYEDINGNARLDFADVVTYFNSMAWITQNGLVIYFDYNRNGRIDFSDVVKLFNMKSS